MAAVAQAPSSSSRGIGVGSTAGFGIGAQHFQRSSSASSASKGIGTSSSSSTGLVCFHKSNSLLCGSPRHHARVWPRQQGSGRFPGEGVNCRCASENFDEQQPSSTGGDGEAANADAWDKRIESALAGIRGPLLGMLSSAGRKFQQYLLKPRIRTSEVVDEVQVLKEETEWDRWQSFFHEVEEQENLLSVLKFDLEEAVEEEDYSEATRIKNEMLAIRTRDPLGQLLGEMKTALKEERYEDAARIRNDTDAGLMGWWAGFAEEGNDPFGRIVNISSSQGRLVARGYSARQLVTAASGVPLFEVFFKKTEEDGYQSQAVYLQRERNTGTDPSTTGTENTNEKSDDGEGDEKVQDDLKSDDKDSVDEGLNRILAFLKGRMPDVKLRVFQASNPEKVESDLPKIGDQLKPADENKKEEELGSSDDGKSENQLHEKASQGKNAATAEELVEMSVRLLIGRLMQNVPEDKLPVLPVRVPAKIMNRQRDSFVFHIEDLCEEKISPSDAMSSWKLAVTAQPSELTSENASKVLSQALPVKVSKEVADIIRLAVNYAQRRRGLAKSTAFHRIRLSKTTADPFNALYVGTLAPYSSQVIQLRQKHGNWQEDDKSSVDSDKFEFTEYVEAVKLVGDLHVPAGQVIFRAKTGRGCRLPHRGVYPDELGVVARYKGRGKVAEPGFKNPHWIDGELLLLDGKGVGFLNGAQLCFVYSVPGQPFLILFRRAMIEENSL